MSEEIEQALELAAGMRLSSEMAAHRSVSRRDTSITRKQIRLFLESLDIDLTVGEIREQLEN